MADRRTRPDTGACRGNRSCSPGRLIVAFSMAGGLFAGGGLITGAEFLRPGVGYLVLGLVPPLFLTGAVAGFVFGAGLAYVAILGRPAGSFRLELRRGMLWALPGLAGAAVVTFWIAYPIVLASGGRRAWTAVAAGGWTVASSVFCWAVLEAWQAFRLLRARWAG